MKKVVFLSLVLWCCSCGLFRKTSQKEKQETHTEQSEKIETKSEVAEKIKQQTLAIENQNTQEILQIRADTISYNTQNGDFSARGNASIISKKNKERQSQQQTYTTTEIEDKKSQTQNSKIRTNQTKKITSKQTKKYKTPFVFQLFLISIFIIIGYLIYKKIKNNKLK